MTGFEFKIYFDSITDQAFSDWFPPPQLNIFAKAALYKSIEYKVATNDRQQVHDDLFSLVSMSDETGTNSFSTTYNRVPLQQVLTDYLHVFAVECLFEDDINVKIINATNSTPITIEVDKHTSLRGGGNKNPSLIKISSVTGNTNANGLSYLKQVAEKKYQLYSDASLRTPKIGNGAYISGGSITVIYKNWAQIINSDERISSLSKPTVHSPRYAVADGALSILPFDKVCQMVKVDYVKKPTVFIDVQDNSYNLEDVYTQRFLYFVADKLQEICKESQKDYEMAASAAKQLQTP
jgi:hypothetical protein